MKKIQDSDNKQLVSLQKPIQKSSKSRNVCLFTGAAVGAILGVYVGAIWAPAFMINAVTASTTAAVQAAASAIPAGSYVLGGSFAANVGTVAGANAYANTITLIGGQTGLTTLSATIGGCTGKTAAGMAYDAFAYTIQGGKSLFTSVAKVFCRKRTHNEAFPNQAIELDNKSSSIASKDFSDKESIQKTPKKRDLKAKRKSSIESESFSEEKRIKETPKRLKDYNFSSKFSVKSEDVSLKSQLFQ